MKCHQAVSPFRIFVLLAATTMALAAPPEWMQVRPQWIYASGKTELAFNGRGMGSATIAGHVLLRTTDGGKTWSHIRRDPQDSIQHLGFLDATTLLAISGRQILHSDDGGLRWDTSLALFPDLQAFKIAFADSKVGVAIGSQGKVARTTDGGRSWSEIGPVIDASFQVADIAFATDRIGVAVGPETIVRTTDGGLTWNPVLPGFPVGNLQTVAFARSNRGYASANSNVMLQTFDGGATWSQIRLFPDNATYRAKFAFGPEGAGIRLFDFWSNRTVDYGESWTSMHLPFNSSDYHSASASGPGPGNFVFGTQSGEFSWSEDAGATWHSSVKAVPSGNLRDFAMLPGGKAVGVGDHGSLVQFIGLGESRQDFFGVGQGLTSENLRAVAFKDSLSGFAVGLRGTVVQTDDGGDSWKTVAMPGTSDLHGLAFAGNGIGCMVGAHGMIQCTQDGGSRWSRGAGDTTGAALRAVAFPDSRHVVAVGDSGSVLASSDGGSSWKRWDDGKTDRNLVCIAFRDRLTGLAGGTGGLLIQTRDGGESWTDYPSPSAGETILSLSISEGGMAVAVLSGGGIWGNILGDRKWFRLFSHRDLQSFRFQNRTRGLAVGLSGQAWSSGTLEPVLAKPSLLMPEIIPHPETPGMKLAWKDVEWADHYRVLLAEDSGFVQPAWDTLVSGTSFMLGLPDASKRYFWKVIPRNGWGEGPAASGGRTPILRAYRVTHTAWSDWSQWTSPAPITGMGPRDSLLWLSTKAGLARIPIQGGPATVYTRSNSGIPFDNLTTVDVSDEDEVLMGSPDGAISLEGGRWTSYTYMNAPLNSGTGNHLVSGITRDKSGTLWLATRSNTYMNYDPPRGWEETDFNSYEFQAHYHAFVEGNQGKVFVLKGNQWSTILDGQVNSLQSIWTVLGILPDPIGNVWAVTRSVYRGEGTSIGFQMGQGENPRMDYRYHIGPIRERPKPWISGMQATRKGMWAAVSGFLNESGTALSRAIVFLPNDAKILSIVVPLSPFEYTDIHDKARFGGPATAFSLDTSGNPWVLARDTLYQYSDDGGLMGTEILPPEVSAQAPFTEMKIDKQGTLFLRNETTVLWKFKPKAASIQLTAKGMNGVELVQGSGGLQLKLQLPGRLRVEYIDLKGRSLKSYDMGIRPAGVVKLPEISSSGSTLLKIESRSGRRYFLVGPKAP